jgi:hypothetical protein
MKNKYFVLIYLTLCLIGCMPSEAVTTATPVFTAITTPQPSPSISGGAIETAVLSTATPITTPTFTPTTLATNVPQIEPSPTITTQPTATATPALVSDFFECLIFSSPSDFGILFIVKDNEPLSLSKYEAGQLTGDKWFGFASKDETVYTVRNRQLAALSESGQTEISFTRIPQYVYGIVDDWLILSSFPLDWTVQQEIGNVTAISLVTSETIIIGDDRPYVSPIVAPDNSELIYWANGEALSWRGEGQIEQRPFPQFRSGVISPNGEFVALLLSGEIQIYNLQTNQLLYQEAFANCPGDGFCFPVWHPNNQQVAYGVYIPEQVPPFAVRLISLDESTVQQFDGVDFPAFSPDGEWMAVYKNVRNKPETVVINLKTREILNTPFSGIPVSWVDSPCLDS